MQRSDIFKREFSPCATETGHVGFYAGVEDSVMALRVGKVDTSVAAAPCLAAAARWLME